MLEIPLNQVPNQQFNIVLDEQDCTIHLYQRNSRLYMDLFLDGVALRYGAVCLPHSDIVAHPYPFTGRLVFMDSLSEPAKQMPPQYAELGTRYQLFYLTDEEAAEIDAQWNIDGTERTDG